MNEINLTWTGPDEQPNLLEEMNRRLFRKLDKSDKKLFKSKGKYFTEDLLEVLELYFLLFHGKEISLSTFLVNFTETFKDEIMGLSDFRFLEAMPEIYEKFTADPRHRVFRVIVVLLLVEVFAIPIKFYQMQPPRLMMKSQVRGQGRLAGANLRRMIARKVESESPGRVAYIRDMLDYLDLDPLSPDPNLLNCRVAVFAFKGSIAFALLKKNKMVKSEGFLSKSVRSREEVELQQEHEEYVKAVLEKIANPDFKPKPQPEFNFDLYQRAPARKAPPSLLRVNRSEDDLLSFTNESKKRKSSLKEYHRHQTPKERESGPECKKRDKSNRIDSLERIESIISQDFSDREPERPRRPTGSMNNLSLYIRDTISTPN